MPSGSTSEDAPLASLATSQLTLRSGFTATILSVIRELT